MRKFGKKSWEFDALEPKVISKLIEKHILKYLNIEQFKKIKEKEEDHRETLNEIAENMD